MPDIIQGPSLLLGICISRDTAGDIIGIQDALFAPYQIVRPLLYLGLSFFFRREPMGRQTFFRGNGEVPETAAFHGFFDLFPGNGVHAAAGHQEGPRQLQGLCRFAAEVHQFREHRSKAGTAGQQEQFPLGLEFPAPFQDVRVGFRIIDLDPWKVSRLFFLFHRYHGKSAAF